SHSPLGMFSDTPHSVFSPRARSSNRGFTLIELLVVIAIILVLAGITFGISRGVQNAQARTKAKAELAVLSQGIEQFKLRYGDYPWHDSDGSDTNKMLLLALTGRVSMERNESGDLVVRTISEDMDNAEVKKRPKFIDETKFSVNEDAAGNSIELLDPWGNPYIYWYKWEAAENNSPTWEVFGYHLYSTGASGDSANDAIKTKINATTGVMDADLRDTANDNGIIFSGE
ncbi:MAG: prepilin-type N-terminal cleavage/methylation domain-containing protein, partial [Opitutae bacterium]|nr:prepilin-type N-terminal cleavage/methylation domain-containing protein [Opitutae bacterium]